MSFDSVSLILLSTAAAAVAEKYLSVLQCIHPWLKHFFIVLEGVGLPLLPIWMLAAQVSDPKLLAPWTPNVPETKLLSTAQSILWADAL